MDNIANNTLKGARLAGGSSGTYGVGYVDFGATVTKNDTITVSGDTYEFFDDVAITAGNIQVTVTGDLTAPTASDAFIVAVNANANSPVTAVDISTSKVMLVTKNVGSTVVLSETFASGSNVVQLMADQAPAVFSALPHVGVYRVVPTAAAVTNDSFVLALDFTPMVATVSVTTTVSGAAVAWDGSATLDVTNNLVTVDNGGTTDWATTDTVSVLVY